MRQMSVVTAPVRAPVRAAVLVPLLAALLVALPVIWAPTSGEAAARKWQGARSPHTTFRGAEVYLPGHAYAGPAAPPIFNDGGAYCWHWFRNGRGWATTWWC